METECVTSIGRGGGSKNKTTLKGILSNASILWDGGQAVVRGKIIEISSWLRNAPLKQQKNLTE